jgi:peptide/nickel transport system substrate-binding protein
VQRTKRVLPVVVALVAVLIPQVLQGPAVVTAQQLFRVVVAQAEDAEDWDPPVAWNTAPEWIEQNAYDCLVFRNASGSRFEPKLAERWERVSDLVFRFHLRPNVRFHDGTPFTAEDIKYHYERIKHGTREQYIVQPQYQFFSEVLVRTPTTVDFLLPEPNTLILNLTSQTGCGVVSRAYHQRVSRDVMHRNPMGTGPFRLRQWVKGERVVLEANRDYWGGKPEVDEFIFRIIPEPSTRLAELLTGGVDVTYGLNVLDEARIRGNQRLRAVWAPNNRGWMLFPRLRVNERYKGDPELDRRFLTEDPRIREAIELAIDKYRLRDLVQRQGEAFRARLFQPLPEANPALWGRRANLYNPQRARELLQEAGYRGQRLVFHAPEQFAGLPAGDLARAITQMLRDVGLNVDLRLLDTNTFNTQIYFPRRTQELILLNLGGNDNPFFGLSQFHTRIGWSPGGYGGASPRLDRLIDCAFQDVRDDARRLRCYHQASEIIADERFVIGLFQTYNLWGIRQDISYTPRMDNYILGEDFKRRR